MMSWSSPTNKIKTPKDRMPYFSDMQLFRRVDKYLDDNIEKKIINKDEMVDELRNLYREYQRRNRGAFKVSVLKAYSLINQNLMNSSPGDRDEDDPDETNDNDPSSAGSSLKAPASNSDSRGDDNNQEELINISSDEEQHGVPTKKIKSSSGAKPSKSYDGPPSHKMSFPTGMFARNLYDPTRMKQRPPVSILPVKKSSGSSFRHLAGLHSAIPQLSFDNFGGYPEVVQTIKDLVLHVQQSEAYYTLGVTPPRGFLLHGPPGCGKTLLAQAVAGELGLPLLKVAGPELIGGMSGESEQRIRHLFIHAKQCAPCVIFIDEIDVICQSRDTARKDMERRIVAQLIACLDELTPIEPESSEEGDEIIVIGATNRPETLDPALRRSGRFDKEVSIGIPNRASRVGVLRVMCSNIKFSPDVSFEKLAEFTPGYVAADLKALISEAATIAVRRGVLECKHPKNEDRPIPGSSVKVNQSRIGTKTSGVELSAETESNVETESSTPEPTEKKDDESNNAANGHEDGEKQEEDKKADAEEKTEDDDVCVIDDDEKPCNDDDTDRADLCITEEDLLKALKTVQPSAKREGFATVPDVTWNDIGSLRDIRSQLEMSIMMPVKYPHLFTRMGVVAPSGVMLCGPPGCGKTLLAKAVANEANINFISVKGPELLNMYVGESERAVRQCFLRARNSQPCVIFFDELDALCPKRSDSAEGNVSSRVVNQVLTEMDGVESREGVFLMAATNRPDMVDPAVLRPGRLDKILFVGLPKPEDRVDILNALTKQGTVPPMSENVSLDEIGRSKMLDGYTGADLAALVKEASVLALAEAVEQAEKEGMIDPETLVVQMKHFDLAVSKIRPSVSAKDQEQYEEMRTLYSLCINGESMDCN